VIITIVGGSGLVGNGIFTALKEKNEVISFDSSIFKKSNNSFYFKKFFYSDLLVYSAGVTNGEIKKKKISSIIKKYKTSIKKLLDFFIKKDLKYFVYISSIHVSSYENSKITETDLKQDKIKYIYCHFTIEKFIKKILKKTNIKCLILRPSNVFGFPKNNRFSRRDLITYSFPMSLIKNNRIILNSEGNQIRNFCSNLDIGKYILTWIKKKKKLDIFTTPVLGKETLSVKKFARKCIIMYTNIYKRSPRLIIKKSNNITKEETNKLYNKSKIDYGYSINNYLNDFYKYF
jgi:UDP-glucose 4-epimerase